jgi:anti-sigma regulatory factor (Ser/Thr protein kinase)
MAARTGEKRQPAGSRVPWSRRPVAAAPATGTTYSATPGSVRAARDAVTRLARDAGASELALADIRLAVSEASSNAVTHAFAAPGVAGSTFAVAAALYGSVLSVWVTDEGRGCAETDPSAGAGVGLSVMAQLCERLELGVLPDGRTQVELRFALERSGHRNGGRIDRAA